MKRLAFLCLLTGCGLIDGSTVETEYAFDPAHFTQKDADPMPSELRLSFPIDLSQQASFPSDAVRNGVRDVQVQKVTYWIRTNTLSVDMPPIELYAAPMAARDERDPRAALIGVLKGRPARSTQCGDQIDREGDARAEGARVCLVPIGEAGRNVLAGYAKDYRTPFQIMARATLGGPVSGTLDFYVRPWVALTIPKN